MKNGLADEVSQLVLKGGSDNSIKEAIERNFPSGPTIGNAEEMLKLVYIKTTKENLQKAINFVQLFNSSLQAQAFKALYDDVIFKKHTEEPEMLLLQKKINVHTGSVLDETKKLVDDDSRKIIMRIVQGIGEKDYSVSIYITESIEESLLNENMFKIVSEFYNGTLENTLQLIQYSQGLPTISNYCFLIDALLMEFDKLQLLESEQAMHLWAYAKYTKEKEGNWPNVAASVQKLCTDAIDKLSPNKLKLYQHYQKYVDDPDKQKIEELHQINWHLRSIVGDFVSYTTTAT